MALTTRCPLRCRYCSVQKNPYPELRGKDWIRIVESFARLRPIELISLEGGEPFLHPDLSVILQACLGVAAKVKIVSSGVISLQSLPANLLHHPRFLLEISLDGPREVHNFLRDGSWGRAWSFLTAALERNIRIGLRSVVSRHNLPFIERWLAYLDRQMEAFGRNIDFSYDPILCPRALAGEGGWLPRAGLRAYPAQGLLPSPKEMWALFRNLKSEAFAHVRISQSEPLRGCGFARCGSISFDPAGIFSFCCESPWGLGWAQRTSPEQCLSLLAEALQNLPCRGCYWFQEDLCRGCWTGQKCGMVEYWGARDCQDLYGLMVQRKVAIMLKSENRTCLAK